MVLVFCSFFSRFILILNTFLSVGISKRKSFLLLLCWSWIPFLFGEHIAVGTWKQSLWSLVLVWCPSLSGLSCLLSAVSVRWSCDYSLVQVMISTVLWVYLFSLSLILFFEKQSSFNFLSLIFLHVVVKSYQLEFWEDVLSFELVGLLLSEAETKGYSYTEYWIFGRTNYLNPYHFGLPFIYAVR